MNNPSLPSPREFANDFLAHWYHKPMSAAPENAVAMRSTQACIDCRLMPARSDNSAALEAAVQEYDERLLALGRLGVSLYPSADAGPDEIDRCEAVRREMLKGVIAAWLDVVERRL